LGFREIAAPGDVAPHAPRRHVGWKAALTRSADEGGGMLAVAFVGRFGEVLVGEDHLGACGCVEDELGVEFAAGDWDVPGWPFADERQCSGGREWPYPLRRLGYCVRRGERALRILAKRAELRLML
jgi:hypothetical protein